MSMSHYTMILLLLAVPWVGLQFVIGVFLDHTHLLFMAHNTNSSFIFVHGYLAQ